MSKLHHANIIVGYEDPISFVSKILKDDFDFVAKANPDFFIIQEDSFGIDNARTLERWAIQKPVLGGIKASVLVLDSMTFEAQNALLKVLEEPREGTYIFISIKNLGNVLPTLLSRVRVLDLGEEGAQKYDKESVFIKSDIKEKLKIVRSLSKDENKLNIKNFINNLELIAQGNKMNHVGIKNILIAKKFASLRGGFPKMLLEWLSCVL